MLRGFFCYTESALVAEKCFEFKSESDATHASHGKRRNGTVISAELMQIVFAFSIWAGAVTWKGTWLIPLLEHVLVNATAGEENLCVTGIVSGIVLIDGVL